MNYENMFDKETVDVEIMFKEDSRDDREQETVE